MMIGKSVTVSDLKSADVVDLPNRRSQRDVA